jgi:hypothetical protein
MKLLKPDGRIDLEHRVSFLRASPTTGDVIAASDNGHISLVDFSSNLTRVHRPTKKIRAISPHPTDPLFAYVDGTSGSLIVLNSTDEPVAEIRPPDVATNSSKSIVQGFDDCYFDGSGEFFWLSAHTSDDECEVWLVETRGWSVAQKSVVADQLGASSCSFHFAGRAGLVSLWMAAGQDGQQVYWLERNGAGFSLRKANELANCTPPIFSQDASEFLIVTQDNSICRYAFPEIKQIGSPLDSGDADNPFAESLCYLDDRNFIAGTGEGRVYLVNTRELRIEEEVALEGHEPRPIGDYYPALTRERGLGTDITWFTRLGDKVVFVFRRDRGTGLDAWKDSLLWYGVNK